MYEAARLRTATDRAGSISAVDAVVAVVAALAGTQPNSVVLTSDPSDLRALVAHSAPPISVVGL